MFHFLGKVASLVDVLLIVTVWMHAVKILEAWDKEQRISCRQPTIVLIDAVRGVWIYVPIPHAQVFWTPKEVVCRIECGGEVLLVHEARHVCLCNHLSGKRRVIKVWLGRDRQVGNASVPRPVIAQKIDIVDRENVVAVEQDCPIAAALTQNLRLVAVAVEIPFVPMKPHLQVHLVKLFQPFKGAVRRSVIRNNNLFDPPVLNGVG